jgi:hypothetical protein
MHAASPRRLLNLRLAGHVIAIVVAALVAWLVFVGYRQPELMLDLANMRLC